MTQTAFCSPVHVVLLLCLTLSFHTATAILQTAAIDVILSDAPPTLASYTFLVSQASFGSYPKMQAKHNVPRLLALPPDDNPLLCDNVTSSTLSSSASASTTQDNTILLVPRGSCTFEQKAVQAQRLGASAILIYGTLASRYALNVTSNYNSSMSADDDHEYTPDDIIYPQNYNDYDCTLGQAQIPMDALSFYPLPYNDEVNDPILSGTSSSNLCVANSPDALASCPSKSCLLTGQSSINNNNNIYMQACCAWDLHVWLYNDPSFTNDAVRIPAAYLTMEQGQTLLSNLQQNAQVTLTLYARWKPFYNPSSLLIWMLGVSIAGVAAYLSAGDYHRLICKAKRQQERRNQPGGGVDDTLSLSQDGDVARPSSSGPLMEESMELTAAHAFGFIVMASTSLLVLFYFKIYGVVKVMYALGCSKAVTNILLYPLVKRFMKRMGRRDAIVWRTNTEDFGDITTRDIVAHAIGYSLGLAWVIMAFTVRVPEANTFFWIMQDVFGACMCILFLQVIKINSIHVATILLLVAFFYDIFFVFVSPLLFGGKSVMITVATSGGPPSADPLWCEKYPNDRNCQGGNPLPMLLTVPRIFDYQGGASLLGLGDIVLPGLLLSFASRLDSAKSLLGIRGGGNGSMNNYAACPERRYCASCSLCSGGYLPPLVVAYAVGLMMANMAVYLMNMGQPALLYLVPCCLGTMCYMGWRRNELKDLWDGPRAIRAADVILYGQELPTEDHSPVPQEDGPVDALRVPSADEETEGDLPLLVRHSVYHHVWRSLMVLSVGLGVVSQLAMYVLFDGENV